MARESSKNGRAFFLGAFILAVASLVAKVHWKNLPDPLPADADPLLFSAGRTRAVVEGLTTCGLRYVGTLANEECGRQLIVTAMDSANVTSSEPGNFSLDFLGGIVSVYKNLTNIFQTIKSQKENPSCTFLVAAHFDSAVGSLGASDNAAQVALLLEIFRILKIRGGLENTDILFLFNGAEETVLQGAHAFTTQIWNRENLEICAFINLEAAGAGGREALFQLGPKNLWLAKAYAQAAKGRGHASSIFQAIFSSKILPAETDFRIFRDFGGAPGFDFALIANGYVYHTPRDDAEAVNYRSMQRYGELVLRLLESLDAAVGRGVTLEEKEDEAIFFDIFGSMIVVYGMNRTSFWLHTALAEILVAVAMFFERPGIRKLFVMLVSLGVAGLGGALLPLLQISAKLILGTENVIFLSYFSSPVLILGIFAAPAVAAFLDFSQFFIFEKSTPRALFIHSRAIFGLLMVALTISRSPASYLPMLWVAFPGLFALIRTVVPGSYAPAVALGYTVPLACTFQVAVSILEMAVPLAGRMGTSLPADLLIGSLTGFLVGVILLGMVDLLLTFNRVTISRSCWVIFFVSSLWACSVRNPYSSEAPKRLLLQEVQQRTVDGRVHEYLAVAPTDFNGLAPLSLSSGSLHLSEFRRESDFLYSGFLPLFIGVKNLLTETRIILDRQISADFLSRLKVTSEIKGGRMDLEISTQGEITVVVIPGEGLLRWSLGGEIPAPRQDCNCHFLKFTQGGIRNHAEFFFWAEFDSGVTPRAEVSTHFVDNFARPELEKLAEELSSGGDWVSPVFTSSAGIEIKR